MLVRNHVDDLTDFLGRTSKDPLQFVAEAFPWGSGELEGRTGPWPWQMRVLTHIRDRLTQAASPHDATQKADVIAEVIRIARASGHGIGKTALVSWIIIWGMATFEDCRGVVTANTKAQLETKTRAELAKWHRIFTQYRCGGKPMLSMTATAMISAEKAHEMTWRFDLLPWSENNPEAFAGLHNARKRLIVIFDEASTIADSIWETIEGAMTDANTEIIWCVFGNPTRNTGRFRECFGRYRAIWQTEQIDAREVPGTNRKLHDEWISLYGEDSDFVRVRVRGVFPRAGSLQFIPTDVADEAQGREVVCHRHDPLVLGVDVARYGDDASVIYIRKGRDGSSHPPLKFRGIDTMTLAGKVCEVFQEFRADAVFVDGTGVGGGVVDRLRQLHVPVWDIQFGSKADNHRDGLADGVTYANKRAEIWGSMREWLKVGSIPRDPELRDQLIGLEYSHNMRQEIQLERKEDMKKRGLESPDIADALALTFAFPVAAHEAAGGDHPPPVVVSDYDPFGSKELAA